MLDTIHLWLSREAVSGEDLLTVAPCLTEIAEHKKRDQLSITGSLHNLRVGIFQSGLSIKGSLAKYYMNDNFQTLQRADTQLAFEQLSDEIHLPIVEAKVTRVDVAQNFVTRYQPEAYYDYLGDCQYFKRLLQPHSIYYRNQNRTKLFYNKTIEGKTKGCKIPEIWKGSQILRYEYRLDKRVTQCLKIDEIKAKDLFSEEIYTRLINEYISQYDNINKLKSPIKLDMDKLKSPKDFLNQFLISKLHEVGEVKALELVEEIKAKGVFKQKEYYSRLKSDIKRLCATPGLTESSDLIAELDLKVKAVKENCR